MVGPHRDSQLSISPEMAESMQNCGMVKADDHHAKSSPISVITPGHRLQFGNATSDRMWTGASAPFVLCSTFRSL